MSVDLFFENILTDKFQQYIFFYPEINTNGKEGIINNNIFNKFSLPLVDKNGSPMEFKPNLVLHLASMDVPSNMVSLTVQNPTIVNSIKTFNKDMIYSHNSYINKVNVNLSDPIEFYLITESVVLDSNYQTLNNNLWQENGIEYFNILDDITNDQSKLSATTNGLSYFTFDSLYEDFGFLRKKIYILNKTTKSLLTYGNVLSNFENNDSSIPDLAAMYKFTLEKIFNQVSQLLYCFVFKKSNYTNSGSIDNLENLHRHESHWEKEIYIETIYKCHGDNTSQYPYYIPWESINCCHSIEVLMDKFYNVSAWKPIKAEVWIENGRSWITEQPTNSNLNRKDIADYPLQIFLAGPEAPLNLAIFQSITDHDAWVNYKLPSDINTFPGITRRIYTGFTGFNANDISDNDPAWHQKVLGKKPATAYWAWDHGPHLDSPWRLTPEVFLTYVNQPQWAAGENPFEHNIHWLIDNRGQHYTTLCGLPRFDYVDGKVLKPKMDGRNIKEVKELSNQFTPIPSVIQIAYEQDILPCNSFKSLYYNMIRLGAGTAINEDIYQGCPLCKKFSKPPKLNFFLKFFYQILILF